MGERGPPPTPASVHQIRGNPSKKPLATLLDEFKPDVELPSCPSWLWKEAKKEWKRVGEELIRYGLVSKLDRAALVLYVQAWAKLVWAEQMLARDMKRADEKRQAAETAAIAAGNADFEWKGGDGFMLPTPNGSFTYSPYWVAAQRAGTEVNRYLALFGLSPSARTRVSQSDQYPFLPGMEPGPDAQGATGVKPAPTLASFSR